MKNTKRDRWASRFYWLGVVMTLSSILLVAFGNTTWGAVVEHTSFPLAWKFGIVAILAFLVGEICRPEFLPRKKDRDTGHVLEHTPYEI